MKCRPTHQSCTPPFKRGYKMPTHHPKHAFNDVAVATTCHPIPSPCFQRHKCAQVMQASVSTNQDERPGHSEQTEMDATENQTGRKQTHPTAEVHWIPQCALCRRIVLPAMGACLARRVALHGLPCDIGSIGGSLVAS